MPSIAYRPHLRIAVTNAHHDIIHHIRISTDREINAAVKFEGLFLQPADI